MGKRKGVAPKEVENKVAKKEGDAEKLLPKSQWLW